MTIKSLPLEHLFHTSKPFLIHSAQLDYPETGKYSWKESQNLQLYIPIGIINNNNTNSAGEKSKNAKPIKQ